MEIFIANINVQFIVSDIGSYSGMVFLNERGEMREEK
jgi:hypothetical protein